MTEHHDDDGGGHDPDTDPELEPDLDLDGFDDFDDLDDPADSGLLGVHLRELLAPDVDLSRQTTHHVDRTLRARSAMSTGLDLFGLGWQTVRTLLTDEPTGADGESEGT